MDKLIALQLSLFILTLLSSQNNAINHTDHDEYESAKDICSRCTCLTGNDDHHENHYVLSCTSKNFSHIIAAWPEEFGNNHTGAELVATFSGNKIEKLHQLPATNATLSFSCQNCQIFTIDSAAFLDVPNLLRLDLSWNNLTGDELTPDIFRGRYSNNGYNPLALDELDLSHNNIIIFDRLVFEHMLVLKKLNLAYNRLDSDMVASALTISAPKTLEVLDISFNRLDTVTEYMLKQLPNLQELYVQGNFLKVVPESLAILGGTLRSLTISENPITSITDDSFLGLSNLTYLNISGMQHLKAIHVGSFAALKSLEVVICNNNPNLAEFDLGSLRHIENFRELDLTNCNLKELNYDYESSNSTTGNKTVWSLQSILLAGNPWHCDCSLIQIVEQISNFGSVEQYDSDDARCQTPYDFSGYFLHKLNTSEVCKLPVPRRHRTAANIENDLPFFARPKSIALSIISIAAVVAVGLLVGFGIVFVKRRLRKDDFVFNIPIQYTPVRNSTISAE